MVDTSLPRPRRPRCDACARGNAYRIGRRRRPPLSSACLPATSCASAPILARHRRLRPRTRTRQPVLHCGARRVLISGDMLLPRISTNVSVYAATPDDDAWDVSPLIAGSRTLPTTRSCYHPTANRSKGIRARVEPLVEHHRERCADLCWRPVPPQTAAALLPTLFFRASSIPIRSCSPWEKRSPTSTISRRGTSLETVDGTASDDCPFREQTAPPQKEPEQDGRTQQRVKSPNCRPQGSRQDLCRSRPPRLAADHDHACSQVKKGVSAPPTNSASPRPSWT